MKVTPEAIEQEILRLLGRTGHGLVKVSFVDANPDIEFVMNFDGGAKSVSVIPKSYLQASLEYFSEHVIRPALSVPLSAHCATIR